jgi:hypothetical protein
MQRRYADVRVLRGIDGPPYSDRLLHRSGDDQGRLFGGANAEATAARRTCRIGQDWYMLSFEGCEDRFTSDLFDRVFSEYKLFSYVEQPGLLLSQMQLAQA